MAQDSQPIPRGNTGKYMKQGQTSGPYGNDPTKDAVGQAAAPAKELKPE